MTTMNRREFLIRAGLAGLGVILEGCGIDILGTRKKSTTFVIDYSASLVDDLLSAQKHSRQDFLKTLESLANVKYNSLSSPD